MHTRSFRATMAAMMLAMAGVGFDIERVRGAEREGEQGPGAGTISQVSRGVIEYDRLTRDFALQTPDGETVSGSVFDVLIDRENGTASMTMDVSGPDGTQTLYISIEPVDEELGLGVMVIRTDADEVIEIPIDAASRTLGPIPGMPAGQPDLAIVSQSPRTMGEQDFSPQQARFALSELSEIDVPLADDGEGWVIPGVVPQQALAPGVNVPVPPQVLLVVLVIAAIVVLGAGVIGYILLPNDCSSLWDRLWNDC